MISTNKIITPIEWFKYTKDCKPKKYENVLIYGTICSHSRAVRAAYWTFESDNEIAWFQADTSAYNQEIYVYDHDVEYWAYYENLAPVIFKMQSSALE